MNRVDEKKLLEQAQQGDAEAFAQIYRQNVQLVFRYIAYRVNDPQLAEDLTGDVFIRALEGLPKYQDRGVPFIAWLYRIAHARVIDHYRRNNRRSPEMELDQQQIPVETDMDATLIRRHAAAELREGMAQLTDEQQQVLILRFIEGHRIEKVAQLMGKNANAIKALQHRALRSLASRLRKSGVDIELILSGLL